ncbi:MAG: toll/interleukin-1 receptor domain-containing protein [Pirellulales bacterium]|nr:toll/interleukin-1 receptor domain-containing protein [Pirellulales bacterium]
MNTTRDTAFISYSTQDKKWGGLAEEALRSLGIRTFLAHDHIQVSEKWKSRINSELKRTHIFVPLLSKNFKGSDWCSQEVGYAFSTKGILIIPMILDETNPYGFINHLQGYRWDSKDDIRAVFVEVLLRERPRFVVNRIVEDVKAATSFKAAERIVKPLVPFFSKFTNTEAARFAEVAAENGKVWDAAQCRDDYLPEFLKQCGRRIPDVVRALLKRRIVGAVEPELFLHPYGNTIPPLPPKPKDAQLAREILERSYDLGLSVRRVYLMPEKKMELTINDSSLTDYEKDGLSNVAAKFGYSITFETKFNTVKRTKKSQ